MKKAQLVLFALLTASAATAQAGRTATATGVVNDSAGKAVTDATVMVYSAGVREGYSTLCPTCYVDCGKRAQTDSEGKFTIAGLDDQLLFNLLVVKAGHSPAWIRKADPLKGPIPAVSIDTRSPVKDPQRVLLGKVVDERGSEVPYALVEPQAASFVDGSQFAGRLPSGDVLAVSDEHGEFELDAGQPATDVMMLVSARAKAPRLLSANPGSERKNIAVSDGATIRGRVVKDGKPMPNVELVLATVRRDMGSIYPEEYVGTDEDGRFMFTNVPAGRVWDLYANGDSLTGRDAMETLQCATERDRQDVDVGDLHLVKGLVFSGRVEITDGKPIPEGMHLYLSSTRFAYSKSVVLAADGSFVVRGLPPGAYVLWPDVKGYRPADGDFGEVLVTRDIGRHVVRLQPVGAAN